MKKYIYLFLLSSFGFTQLSGQCYPDRHNTNWFDGWISCETAPNPNDSYADSHWILYDFKDTYELGQLHVWNSNDPSHLDYGMQDVSIDYSLDGIDWINLGNFSFEMASGKSIYEGFKGPNFNGALARYVLITGLSNYGGECFGLSELRFEVQESTVHTGELRFAVDCASTEEGVLLEWTVQGILDDVQYLIQRSDDAESWILLKTTEKFRLGEGTHTFHYIDNENIDGSAYYRLVSRQNDGREDVSNSHYCTNKQLEARVYPNPMPNQGNLEIISQESSTIFIQLTNVYGQILYEDSFVPTSLTSTISLDQLGLREGQYFIRVRQAEVQRSLKLIRM